MQKHQCGNATSSFMLQKLKRKMEDVKFLTLLKKHSSPEIRSNLNVLAPMKGIDIHFFTPQDMPKSVKTKKVIDGPFRKSMSKSKFIDFKHPIFLVFSNKTRFSPRFWLSCIQLQKVLIVGIKVYGFRAKKRKNILAHQGIEPGTSRL